MVLKMFFLLLVLSLYSSSSSSQSINPSNATSPTAICKSTPNPNYCKSVLLNQTGNVYSYGRYSIRKSLSQSKKFLSLVEKYLKRSSTLSKTAVGALQDCQTLSLSTIDYLSNTFQTISFANQTLSVRKSDDMQTFLSAALTNQQTCLEGLNATAADWRVKDGLSFPLNDDSKLFSVSLALFDKGWAPKYKKSGSGKKHSRVHHGGELPFRMTGKTRAVYDSLSTNRNLLEGGDEVLVSDIITVSQDGSGNFTTINDALSAAPNNSRGDDGYFLIYVTAGVYEEYVSVAKNKKFLMMVGDGINQTIITGNRSVVDGWTTFNSATFAVVAPNFVAVNITFRNTAGPAKHQAVAVRSGADLSIFYSCSFEAYQDTLYTHSLRQFYRECDIYGTVDFIFGNAAVVFQSCNMYPRQPMQGQFNAITAQGRTDPNQNTGTSIHNCTIRPADDLVASTYSVQTYLGRPWKEYSRTVYMESYIDGFLNPEGWRSWNGDFALNTLFYAEYNNTGPGSDTTRRVTWAGFSLMDSVNATNFTVTNFLMGDDWIPQTGVAYTSGLLS